MPTQKQITVSLENKPGRLAQLLSELARQKINVVALAVMDRNERGVLRLVTEDAAATGKVLQSLNVPLNESDVLAVELRNQPGALAHVCETLAAEHISIEYAYCSSGGRNGKVYGIFKVSNHDKAARLLSGSANHTAPKRKGKQHPLRDRRSFSGMD